MVNYDKCLQDCVPKKMVTVVNRRKKPPWWNEIVADFNTKLNRAKKSYKRRSTKQNFDHLKETKNNFDRAVEEEKNNWIKGLCSKINLCKSSKEMWDTFNNLTSYQDLDGGDILPLLDCQNQPIFEVAKKCDLLRDTFFSGKHLENVPFDGCFQQSIEEEFQLIKELAVHRPLQDMDLNGLKNHLQ